MALGVEIETVDKPRNTIDLKLLLMKVKAQK